MKIRIRKYLRNLVWGGLTDYYNTSLKRKGKRWVFSERGIECPYAHREIARISGKCSVLDVGCARSVFPIELANLGYNVTGIDFRDYQLEHENLRFIKGDFITADIGKFDIVICISTYEHIGTGAYNKRNVENVQAFRNKLLSSLHPAGYLIITVPLKIEKKGFIRFIKREEISSLGNIIDSFKWENIGCYTIKKFNGE